MSLWKHFSRTTKKERDPKTICLKRELLERLSTLAKREKRTEEEIANELLAAALSQHAADEGNLHRWQELSRREQEVVALTCLGYTNRQIAVRLSISSETVKTHVRNALRKFGMHRKSELWKTLEHWDFSAWDTAQ